MSECECEWISVLIILSSDYPLQRGGCRLLVTANSWYKKKFFLFAFFLFYLFVRICRGWRQHVDCREKKKQEVTTPQKKGQFRFLYFRRIWDILCHTNFSLVFSPINLGFFSCVASRSLTWVRGCIYLYLVEPFLEYQVVSERLWWVNVSVNVLSWVWPALWWPKGGIEDLSGCISPGVPSSVWAVVMSECDCECFVLGVISLMMT